MSQIEAPKAAKTTEHDITKGGICSEPFKEGEVAVQAARWRVLPPHLVPLASEKFWAHAVCVFTVARETGGPSEKHKPR